MTADLDAIRQRLAAITPGPWEREPEYARILDATGDLLCSEVLPNDAEFIAAAPADIRALLAAYDAQQQRIAELEVALRGLVNRDDVLDFDAEYQHWDCPWCEVSIMSEHFEGPRDHAVDCAWVKAQKLISPST